jgi:hypothetical protein
MQPRQLTRDGSDVDFLSEAALEPLSEFAVGFMRVLVRVLYQLGGLLANSLAVLGALLDDHVFQVRRLVGPPSAQLNLFLEFFLEPCQIFRLL